jgi:hypothetical protein
MRRTVHANYDNSPLSNPFPSQINSINTTSFILTFVVPLYLYLYLPSVSSLEIFRLLLWRHFLFLPCVFLDLMVITLFVENHQLLFMPFFSLSLIRKVSVSHIILNKTSALRISSEVSLNCWHCFWLYSNVSYSVVRILSVCKRHSSKRTVRQLANFANIEFYNFIWLRAVWCMR